MRRFWMPLAAAGLILATFLVVAGQLGQRYARAQERRAALDALEQHELEVAEDAVDEIRTLLEVSESEQQREALRDSLQAATRRLAELREARQTRRESPARMLQERLQSVEVQIERLKQRGEAAESEAEQQAVEAEVSRLQEAALALRRELRRGVDRGSRPDPQDQAAELLARRLDAREGIWDEGNDEQEDDAEGDDDASQGREQDRRRAQAEQQERELRERQQDQQRMAEALRRELEVTRENAQQMRRQMEAEVARQRELAERQLRQAQETVEQAERNSREAVDRAEHEAERARQAIERQLRERQEELERAAVREHARRAGPAREQRPGVRQDLLRQAAQLMRQLGDQDMAHELIERAERAAREEHPHPHHEHPPWGEVLEMLEQMRNEIRQLRGEVRELHELVRERHR